MAAREDIIRGLEFTISEGRRVSALFTDAHWRRTASGGWTPKQVFAHLAATAESVPRFAAMLSQAPAGTNLRAAIDIDAMNAQAVAAREGASVSEVLSAFEAGYQNLIAFVRSVPQAQLDAPAPCGAEPASVSDIMATAVVPHALHHIYEAATAS